MPDDIGERIEKYTRLTRAQLEIYADPDGYNDPVAQNALGVRCANGHGGPQNSDEAVKWFRRAADQDFGLAKQNLGMAHHKGDGVTANLAIALKLYMEALCDPIATHNQVGAMISDAVKGASVASGEGKTIISLRDGTEFRFYTRPRTEGRDAEASAPPIPI